MFPSSLCVPLAGLLLVAAPVVLARPSLAQDPLFARVHEMLPVSGINAAATGDLDGDGDDDVIASTGLFLNDGAGIFRDATAANMPGWLEAQAIAVGDVDGDGDLDVMANSYENCLYLNDGTGVFTDVRAQKMPREHFNTMSIALGDVDGDGDLDALIGNAWDWYASASNRLFINDGTGTFTDVAGRVPSIQEPTQSVALGDVDGDGDLDALIGNGDPEFVQTGYANHLYLNDGTGRFTAAPSANWPPDQDSTVSVKLGDLDGDGDLDVFVGNLDVSRLYLNNGGGQFGSSWAVPLGATGPVLLGDVDGDGDLDVRTERGLYENSGAAAFSDVSAKIPVNPASALTLADADGDGDLDTVTTLGLQLNDGTGSFGETAVTTTVDHTTAVALGDVDGDGDLDVFAVNGGEYAGAQANRLMVNDGKGGFVDVSANELPQEASASNSVALGDIDGDGDLDALIGTGARSGLNRVYVNDGSGKFSDETAARMPPDADDTYGAALADMNGDGILDAVVINDAPNNSSLKVYRNDGTGHFGAATSSFVAGFVRLRTLGLGDLDGDGDIDVHTGNSLYWNDGTGLLTEASAAEMPPGAAQAYAVAVGDVDGDGDLDVYTANYRGVTNPLTLGHLYLNDGHGTFTDESVSRLPVGFYTSMWAASLADVDGDGDLDLIALSRPYFADGAVLCINDGSGVFADATSTYLPTYWRGASSIAFGDLDGDGDPDAWIGNMDLRTMGLGASSRDSVLINQTRQFAWRGTPRVGKPLILDFHGTPGGSGAIWASQAVAASPLSFGALGVLWLEPVLTIPVASVMFGPSGSTSLNLSVGPSPSLIGASIYWQGLVTGPLRLTNLEVTTFTDL